MTTKGQNPDVAQRLAGLSPLKRALIALDEMQARLNAIQGGQREPIAIIGMGCRFPGGAVDAESFWRILADGVDTVKEVPADRWLLDRFFDPDPDVPGKMYTRYGAFLDTVDGFDAEFFGIAPREALCMDPQQRLLLEVSWEALEDAGCSPSRLLGSPTGVYIGISASDYAHRSMSGDRYDQLNPYSGTGCALAIAPGRLSYLLGLQGPSLALDTACSSSLVAVHLACQSLRLRECHLALAGGVNLMLSPGPSVYLSKVRALSPDGRCKTFDAAADGYGRGEGCGIIVLKRLSDALSEGDRVLAVIRGSAVNQDGRSSGLTAPNGPSQEAVVRKALEAGGVQPSAITYVETHGTGTPLGDPIELRALGAALRNGTTGHRFAIGSVKTNIGHLEAAAGIAGLIKVVLAMQHGEIPPHLHLKAPNPHARWDELPVWVPTVRESWRPSTTADGRRLAGVSSFGLSGTNAHIILEESPAREGPRTAEDRPVHLLTLSARTETALRELVARYRRYLDGCPASLPDICYTANSGRAHFAYRLSLMADTLSALREQLNAYIARKPVKGLTAVHLDRRTAPTLAFLFRCDQSAYTGMGRELYRTQPVFRSAIGQCEAILDGFGEPPLTEVLFGAADKLPEKGRRCGAFAIQYGLAELWRSWGIDPEFVTGEGVGEIVAATVAGAIALEDGLRLVLAAAEQVEAIALGMRCERPRLGLVSSVSGRLLREAPARDFWIRPAGEPFRRWEALETLKAAGCELLVDVGPGELSGHEIGKCFPMLREGIGEWEQMLGSLAALYSSGVEVDWEQFDRPYGRSKVALPFYPFERQRFWMDPAVPHAPLANSRGTPDLQTHPLLGQRLLSPAIQESIFDSRLSPKSLSFLEDHKVYGVTIVPGACYVSMLLSAAAELFGTGPHSLKEVVFPEAQALDENRVRRLQVILEPPKDGETSFRILSRAEEDSAPLSWVLHAEGKLVTQAVTAPSSSGDGAAIQDIQERCREQFTAVEVYQRAAQAELQLGPQFRWIDHVWRRDGEALARMRLPELIDDVDAYQLHPGLIDSCFQLLGAGAPASGSALTAYAPVAIGEFRLHTRPSGAPLWCHALMSPGEEHRTDTLKADLRLVEESGQVVATGQGVLVKRALKHALLGRAKPRMEDWLYEIEWQPSARRTWRPVSEYVTSPSLIARGLERRLIDVGSEFNLDVYVKLSPELDALSSAYARQAFEKLFGEKRQGARLDAASLAERFPGAGLRGRLLQLILAILEDEGFLRRDESGWRVISSSHRPDPQARYQQLLQAYPECEAELSLLARCANQLSDVVTGEADPLQVLFPGGSAANVEKLYRTAPAARAINLLAAEAAAQALEGRPPDRLVRILEIGAGTGSTTASVLPRLPADSFEYVFTDVSPLLVSKAHEKFHGFPSLRYRVLDIERDPVAQGFDAHAFDLILASNVLHATSNLRQTLRHVRRLLAPSGLLVVVENTRRQRWLDLIFGLTEGWWKFADHDIRPSHPLVGRRTWLSLLAEAGFGETAAVPGESTDHDSSPQAMLIAQAPGSWTTDTASEPEAGWLVFADNGGVARSLAQRFGSFGHQCVSVVAGSAYEKRAPTEFTVDPACPGDFVRLLEESPLTRYLGVVHCWSLDVPEAEFLTGTSMDAAQILGSASAIHLVQSLCRRKDSVSAPLWLITRGAQAVALDTGALAAAQAPLWGLGKVISLEHPELRCVRVDLDPAGDSAGNAAELAEEIWSRSQEEEIAFRRGARYAPRLVRRGANARNLAKARLQLPGAESFQLEIETRGVLDNLSLKPVPRRAVGRDEVEIQVSATGLNFRDLLNAMGMYPGDAGPMGLECAGIVTAIGEGVTGISVGDEVLAVSPGSFSPFVTTRASFVAPKPAGMTFAEAATIPIAFLTSYYSLHRLARIAPGDRVLIHAAAGGVGLAAVQLAQVAGAEVFATAGSPDKQAYLRSIGVRHIASSRTLDFADEFMRITGGRGVTVVLNSLSGDFIPNSLLLLQPGGRFVEIGKIGILTSEQVAAIGKDIAYFAYDLARQCVEQPDMVASMLRELMDLFRDGSLRPLPVHAFEIEDSIDAFRFMQQARHLGKIVITQHKVPPVSSVPPPVAFLPDATYLITGGLRGLGLLTAQWMVERGARHLVLVGRSGPAPAEEHLLDLIRGSTVSLRIERADVASREQMVRVIGAITAGLHPLRGIVHSAGVLDDGVILEQNWARFAAVMAPKVLGAWNLHVLTRDLALDFFTLYSSIVSMIGSPGQANHTAANAFLDALAHYRRKCSLPAVSINWGAWSEVGAAARGNVGSRVRMQGIAEISPSDGLRVLEMIWHASAAQVGVLPVDWSEFLRSNPAAGDRTFLAAITREARSRTPTDSGARADLLRRLAGARPSERMDVLLTFVQAEASKVLGLDPSRALDLRRPLNEIGLDSLMAVELRNALSNLVGRTLPVTLLFDYPAIQGLAGYLAAEVFPTAATEPVSTLQSTPLTAQAPSTAVLTGEELVASLDRELANFEQWIGS